MEPNTIEESIKGLLEAIKESPEYLEFQKQSDILKKKPELKARVLQPLPPPDRQEKP